jgi:hypothetical protein
MNDAQELTPYKFEILYPPRLNPKSIKQITDALANSAKNFTWIKCSVVDFVFELYF